MTPLPRLYAMADASFGDCVQIAEALFAGGARLVQVRNKTAAAGDVLAQVERIMAFAPSDAQVMVNDRVDIALLAGAAGVHLGQTDLPPVAARRMLGPGRIIGYSTHNLNQALDADGLPVDYIAVGPIFATATKENPDPVLGVDKLREICRAVRKPVVAIGGIRLDDAQQVLNAGAQSVAVIRDLLVRSDISEGVRTFERGLKPATT
jgi:thiamine-phosphate pyrophosphorylase